MPIRIKFKFQILKSRSKKQPFYWRCKSINGETRCSSETYTQKNNAKNAIISFIRYMKPGCAIIEDLT